MAPRSASAHGDFVAVWLALMLTGFSHLKRLRPSRQASDSPDTLSRATLKDIGLSPCDLPSVRAGQFFSDTTRIQR